MILILCWPHAPSQERIAARKTEAIRRRAAGGGGTKAVVTPAPPPARVRGSGVAAKQCQVLERLRAHDCLGVTTDLVPCLGPNPMKTIPCSVVGMICKNCNKGYKSCANCKKTGVCVIVCPLLFFLQMLLLQMKLKDMRRPNSSWQPICYLFYLFYFEVFVISSSFFHHSLFSRRMTQLAEMRLVCRRKTKRNTGSVCRNQQSWSKDWFRWP